MIFATDYLLLSSLFYLQRQPFQAKNNPEKNQWCSRDVDAMAEVTGSLPILVDADAGKIHFP